MFPSKDWTPEERLQIIAAWANQTFDLVRRSGFYSPNAVLSDLQAINFIAVMPAQFLNDNINNIQPFIDLVKE